MEQKEFQEYFASDYKGADSLLKDILIPLFGGKFTEGYDTLTDDPDVKAKAAEANIECIKHKGDLHALAYDVKVYDVTIKDNCRIAQSRQGIQNVIRQYIDSFEGAFIAFHYENTKGRSWRLSFVEKMDKAKNSTSAKRYTYICGEGSPCRTIAERFYLLQNGEINSKTLLDAFSVEALSDEFFDKYKAIYANFVQYITGKRIVKVGNEWKEKSYNEPEPELYTAFGGKLNKGADNEDADKRIRNYIKKTMGRVTFLYFLQRKGWLNGDSNFMSQLYNNSQYKDDFLDKVLEPLFYTILNTAPADRRAAFEKHNANIDTKKEVEWDVKLLDQWKDIPFLNGGLFERDADDVVRTQFPQTFFWNELNGVKKYAAKEKDLIPGKDYPWEKIPGLLDFFNQYNFTIDENDPNDAEVGVDPEMLGRVFENLLEDNKDKGAFYTPKEIVQYMCRESLISYIQTNVEGHNDAIRKFVEDSDIKDVPESNAVLSALRNVKICDPAIGSGAFPMGMLNLLVTLREKLGDTKKRVDLKKEIISNNIYGVDIERGAVDIARLRFWLSIVVDEDNSLALPNLDYKIMQGNSLLEEYEEIDLSKLQQQVFQTKIYEPQRDLFGGMSKNQMKTTYTQADTSADLQNLLLQYYPETNHDNKAELKNHINEVVKKHILYNIDLRKNQAIRLQNEADEAIAFNESKITDLRKQFPNKTLPASATAKYDKEIVKLRKQKSENEAAIKKYERAMSDLETLDLNGNEQLFLWHTWFADVFENEGFDIVIGNPPYVSVRTKNFDTTLKPIYKKNYTLATGQYDLYTLFIELSNRMLAPNGVLSFIIPTRMLSNENFMAARLYVLDNLPIFNYVDAQKPFENANVEANIMVCKKGGSKKIIESKQLDNTTKQFNHISEIDYSSINRMPFSIFPFVFKQNRLNVLFKIQDTANKKQLCEYLDITRGFECGYNDTRIGSGEYKFIMSESIFSYCINQTTTMYCNPDFTDVSTYKTRDIFCKTPKLLTKFCSNEIVFALDNVGYCNTNSVYNCALKALAKNDLNFLLGILNSKLTTFWFNTAFLNIDTLFPHIQKNQLDSIPIPTVTPDQHKTISDLVDKILAKKQANPAEVTSELEQKIDLIVYRLYGLTFDDVKIVDPKTSITKAQYEKS